MATTSELDRRLLENPEQIRLFRDLERLVRACGFRHERTKGSHRSYKHERVREVLTLQPRGKDARSYQVRLFLAMLRKYDLKLDD